MFDTTSEPDILKRNKSNTEKEENMLELCKIVWGCVMLGIAYKMGKIDSYFD